MAPEAGTVADRHEEQFSFILGLGEGLRSPRIPVHGIMGMLEKIGAAFVSQPVARTCFGGQRPAGLIPAVRTAGIKPAARWGRLATRNASTDESKHDHAHEPVHLSCFQNSLPYHGQ